jgi:hypothetical protein
MPVIKFSPTHFFLERIAQVNNGLFLHQSPGQARLSLFAIVGSGGLNLLEAGNGGAACRFRYALAPTYSALLLVHFNLAIFFSLSSTSAAVVVSNLFKIILLLSESSRGRPAAFPEGERDRDVGRQSVLVDLFTFVPLHIAVSWKRSAVKGIQGRLSAHELWAGWPSAGRWSRLSPINVDVDVNVLVDDRLATVRSQCAVGYLGWRGLFKDVVAAAVGLSEAIVLEESLPLHNGCSTAGAVLVDVDIAVVARAFVVLVEAKVVVVVSSTTISATSAAVTAAALRRATALRRSTRTPPHTLEPCAIPALTTGRRRWIIIAVQCSCRGTSVHTWVRGRLTLGDVMCRRRGVAPDVRRRNTEGRESARWWFDRMVNASSLNGGAGKVLQDPRLDCGMGMVVCRCCVIAPSERTLPAPGTTALTWTHV